MNADFVKEAMEAVLNECECLNCLAPSDERRIGCVEGIARALILTADGEKQCEPTTVKADARIAPAPWVGDALTGVAK